MLIRLGILSALIFFCGIEGWTENIRFVQRGVYDTGFYPDQQNAESFLVVGNFAFCIGSYHYSDQFNHGCLMTVVNMAAGTWERVLSFYTTSDAPPEYNFPALTGVVVQIGDQIVCPDKENYSYQFTLDGHSLGRFPNYQPPAQTKTYPEEVLLAGKPIDLPISTTDETYRDMYFMDPYVIFVGERGYSIFKKMELAQKGLFAERAFLQFPSDRLSDASFIPTKIDRAYIIYRTQTKYKTTVLSFAPDLTEITLQTEDMDQPPDRRDPIVYDFKYEKSIFFGKEYYRLEQWFYDYYKIVKYQILGLEGVSALPEENWELLK